MTARELPSEGVERDDYFKRYIELCNDLECRLLKIESDAEWLHGAAEYAMQAQVKLAINNHTGNPLETADGALAFLEKVNHANFGLLFDSLHLHANNQDYIGFIEPAFKYVRNILVHSIRPARKGDVIHIARGDRKFTFGLPDEKEVQDSQSIFNRFRELGYDGLVTSFESNWSIEKRKDIAKHCAGVIRELWNNAG